MPEVRVSHAHALALRAQSKLRHYEPGQIRELAVANGCALVERMPGETPVRGRDLLFDPRASLVEQTEAIASAFAQWLLRRANLPKDPYSVDLMARALLLPEHDMRAVLVGRWDLERLLIEFPFVSLSTLAMRVPDVEAAVATIYDGEAREMRERYVSQWGQHRLTSHEYERKLAQRARNEGRPFAVGSRCSVYPDLRRGPMTVTRSTIATGQIYIVCAFDTLAF